MFKEFAYQAQQRLQSATSVRFSRAHLYEWVSAGFGFGSYAAFSVDHLLVRRQPGIANAPVSRAQMEARGQALGSSPLLSAQAARLLEAMLIEREVTVVNISFVLDELRSQDGEWYAGDWHDDPEDDVDDEFEGDNVDDADEAPWIEDFDEPSLLSSLREAAERGSPKAHYALALILEPAEEDDSQDGRYWYEQQLQGRVLEGATKEWAVAYEARAEARRSRQERDLLSVLHLKEAARLGSPEAQLALAARFGDPTFFESGVTELDWRSKDVAAIAEQLGRVEDARKWLRIAAEEGDTEAMRELIESHDQHDLLRCWTWVHLSRLLHHDLTQDRYYAINPDGSEYDFDVGGPAEVAGEGGVVLRRLSAVEDEQAQDAAERLFRKIEAGRR